MSARKGAKAWRELTAAATLALTPMLAGCNTSGCTDNQSALPLAGFYSASTGSSITVSNLEIGGVDAPDDSLLYSTGTGLSEVYLPFRSTADETAYVIAYSPDGGETRVSDRITFGYTSEPYFASEECGAMFYYRIGRVDYTRNIIDSVAVTDSLITNSNVQQIKIYFRTSEQ